MREAMKNLPLRAELLDPRGNTAAAWDLFLPESGFGELEYPVAATAPTGLYSLELRLRDGSGKGELLRALFFRVEEFQPDTLRLNVAVSPVPPGGGWLRPQDLKEGLAAGLELENLFGAPRPERGWKGGWTFLRPCSPSPAIPAGIFTMPRRWPALPHGSLERRKRERTARRASSCPPTRGRKPPAVWMSRRAASSRAGAGA